MRAGQRKPIRLGLIALAVVALCAAVRAGGWGRQDPGQVQGDAGLRLTGNPGQPERGRGAEDRRPEGQKRPRPQPGHLGGGRLLPAPGPDDREGAARLAGLVGRAPGELPRGPVRPQPLQAGRRPARRTSSTTTSSHIGEPGHHQQYQPVPDSQVPFAREWGMNTEIQDLRMVVKAAGRKGGTWRWAGTRSGDRSPPPMPPGTSTGVRAASDLSGLVLIDGASSPTPVTAPTRRATSLDEPADLIALVRHSEGSRASAGIFGMVGSSADEGRDRTHRPSSPNGPCCPRT